MLSGTKRHPLIGGGAILLTLLALAGPGAPAASAAGPPIVVESWAASVFSTSATLQGKVNPNGLFTTYHFDFITKAAHDANLAGAKEPFTGAARVPISADANAGTGESTLKVSQQASGLKPDTTYYYRLAARNSAVSPNYVFGETNSFTTQGSAGAAVLADSRGWEMVSPIDKNGGEAAGFGAIADGGVLQAAAGGGSVTYGSEASFGSGGEGAPPASQYIATRISSGWAATNISPPLYSGSYDTEETGTPYQLFSGDLARGLLLNGEHCRGEGSDCAVPNPPLAGTDAPAGYQNYYLREGGAFKALLGAANSGFLALDPSDFELSLAGTSLDLRHGVISTCAALTSNATEVPMGEGCDPEAPNLYLYSPAAGLSLINILPSESTGNPGAALAAQMGAVSADGARVYWVDTATDNLYVRAGGQTKLVGEDATFETASADGSLAFYTKADEHLYRYDTGTSSSTDLTPAGEVEGVLGASASGDAVYYLDGGEVKLRKGAATKPVAAGADADNHPPGTGTARVLPDGTKLLFVSSEQLTGYDNTDLASSLPCGEPGGVCDSQVFLYDDSGAGKVTCVSCNPTNGRPIGPSTVPGAIANGSAEDSLEAYKPRALSANGKRVFFDSSDALVSTDTNNAPDAYQWEAQGEGSCNKTGGCISLISGGRGAGGGRFVDASSSGADAYFLTDESLVKADPGAVDLYDARVGGGFPVPIPPIPCEGDACQSLPPQPVDPTLTTKLRGPGNPGVRYPKQRRGRCPRGKVKRKGKCVRKRCKGGKVLRKNRCVRKKRRATRRSRRGSRR